MRKYTLAATLFAPVLVLAAGNDAVTDVYGTINKAGDIDVSVVSKGECPVISMALLRDQRFDRIQFAELTAGIQTKKSGTTIKGESGPILGNWCTGTIPVAELPAVLLPGDYSLVVRVDADLQVKLDVMALCDDPVTCRLYMAE